MAVNVVYYSTKSENTKRFVDKLNVKSCRIPIKGELSVSDEFVLIVPTYANPCGKGAVPKQVIKFLNDKNNRSLIRGVISSGNTNFGNTFGVAGDIISKKCNVPLLYKFELAGTKYDVDKINRGLNDFFS